MCSESDSAPALQFSEPPAPCPAQQEEVAAPGQSDVVKVEAFAPAARHRSQVPLHLEGSGRVVCLETLSARAQSGLEAAFQSSGTKGLM